MYGCMCAHARLRARTHAHTLACTHARTHTHVYCTIFPQISAPPLNATYGFLHIFYSPNQLVFAGQFWGLSDCPQIKSTKHVFLPHVLAQTTVLKYICTSSSSTLGHYRISSHRSHTRKWGAPIILAKYSVCYQLTYNPFLPVIQVTPTHDCLQLIN